MTSNGVGKPHWRLTEERSMMRVVVVEKLLNLGRSPLKVWVGMIPNCTRGTIPATYPAVSCIAGVRGDSAKMEVAAMEQRQCSVVSCVGSVLTGRHGCCGHSQGSP